LSGIVPGISEGDGRVGHEDQAKIAKILRDHIIFSRHDLLTDPPFSTLDLIFADNVFTDLDEPACQRIAMMLHDILNPDGYLWLGAAPSMPPPLSDWFEPRDRSSSCYRRRPDRKTSPSCFLAFKHRFDGRDEYHGQKHPGSCDVASYDQLLSEHEELRTLSEQLQAANEEAEANNQELQSRTGQLGATLDQLEASERRYRSIVEDQSDFICRHDAAGTLTFVNSAFCRAYGVTEAECLGKPLTDVLAETSSWQTTL
jgi:PAS domain-containing protein